MKLSQTEMRGVALSTSRKNESARNIWMCWMTIGAEKAVQGDVTMIYTHAIDGTACYTAVLVCFVLWSLTFSPLERGKVSKFAAAEAVPSVPYGIDGGFRFYEQSHYWGVGVTSLDAAPSHRCLTV